MVGELNMAGQTEKPSALTRTLKLETRTRVEFKDVTVLLERTIAEMGVRSGACHLFVPHTTAAILINENADPALLKDLDNFLSKLAPAGRDYQHNDGNCDAHLKASLIGSAQTLFIENGRLLLGRWQGVYFCEFDGPRRRALCLKIVPD